MFPIKEFEKRFREILTALDDVAADAQSEELDEMNATFEDALFVIESIGEEDEDRLEAFSDALEEFEDLCEEYDSISQEIPDVAETAGRLKMLVGMIRGNME